ncbi:kunitz-type serine protease inhibitor A [Drosophila obscura]|uniref:kunitz-type serine protease inhibitor A n=1 Tax=Drosophila obscura TaxID=7282 RepID=UPI001BB24A38|nr:kunitz-type serine protease inhibitor A [Drosophila obscura]
MLMYAILLALLSACPEHETADKYAKLFVDFTILQESCLFRPVYGRCKENIKVYGYDYENNVCVEYFYSGCGGNTNRFTSAEECKTLCSINRENEIKVARDKDPYPSLGATTEWPE